MQTFIMRQSEYLPLKNFLDRRDSELDNYFEKFDRQSITFVSKIIKMDKNAWPT